MLRSPSLTTTTPARISSPPASWARCGSSPSSSQEKPIAATTSSSATNDASREPSRRPAATPVAYATGVAAGRRLGSRLASFVALLEVVAAIGFSWLLLGELPHRAQLAGGLLILAGVVVVKLGERSTIHPR